MLSNNTLNSTLSSMWLKADMAEEKARIIYEEIPNQILRFTVEYLWQSDFHWQSNVIRKILDQYGEPSKN